MLERRSHTILRLAAVAVAATCVVFVVGGSLRQSTSGAARRAELISLTPPVPLGCERTCMDCVQYALAGYEMVGQPECEVCECSGSIPGMSMKRKVLGIERAEEASPS